MLYPHTSSPTFSPPENSKGWLCRIDKLKEDLKQRATFCSPSLLKPVYPAEKDKKAAVADTSNQKGGSGDLKRKAVAVVGSKDKENEKAKKPVFTIPKKSKK